MRDDLTCNIEQKENHESKIDEDEGAESHSDEGEQGNGQKGEMSDLKYISSDTDLARV